MGLYIPCIKVQKPHFKKANHVPNMPQRWAVIGLNCLIRGIRGIFTAAYNFPITGVFTGVSLLFAISV